MGPGPSGPTVGAQPPHPSAECLRAVSGPQTIFGMRPGPAKCGRALFRTPGQRSPAPWGGPGPVAPPAGGRPALPRFGSGPLAPAPGPPGPGGRASTRRRGRSPACSPLWSRAAPPLLLFGGGFASGGGFLRRGFPPAGVPPGGGFSPSRPPPGEAQGSKGAGPIWGGLAWILAGTPACQGQGLRRLRPLDRLEPPPLLGSQGRLRGEVYHRST